MSEEQDDLDYILNKAGEEFLTEYELVMKHKIQTLEADKVELEKEVSDKSEYIYILKHKVIKLEKKLEAKSSLIDSLVANCNNEVERRNDRIKDLEEKLEYDESSRERLYTKYLSQRDYSDELEKKLEAFGSIQDKHLQQKGKLALAVERIKQTCTCLPPSDKVCISCSVLKQIKGEV